MVANTKPDMNIENFNINYENVINAKWLSKATRKLAQDRMKNPYMSVGDYFLNLDDESLNEYLDLVNQKDETSATELMLISEILCRGEGLFTDDIEEMGKNIGYLRMLIAAVALGRKKLVRVNYENISFSRDMMDRVVIERYTDD